MSSADPVAPGATAQDPHWQRTPAESKAESAKDHVGLPSACSVAEAADSELECNMRQLLFSPASGQPEPAPAQL